MPTALFRLVALAGLLLMPTTTVYSEVSDGEIYSPSTTLSTAQAGGGSTSAFTNLTALDIGQQLSGATYELYESFLSFDLLAAGIPANAVVSAVTLQLFGDASPPMADDGDYDIEARTHDWGATLTTADWVATGSLSGKTLLATLGSASFATSDYNVFAENGTAMRSAVTSALAGSGKVYVLLCTSQMTNGDTPAGANVCNFNSADYPDTSQDPKLVVTYTVPAGGQTNLLLLGCGS